VVIHNTQLDAGATSLSSFLTVLPPLLTSRRVCTCVISPNDAITPPSFFPSSPPSPPSWASSSLSANDRSASVPLTLSFPRTPEGGREGGREGEFNVFIGRIKQEKRSERKNKQERE